MTNPTFILIFVLTAMIGCHSSNEKDSGSNESLGVVVEVVPEGDSSYSISWKDTVGLSAGYELKDRPSEVWCFIIDKKDTVGYYRGRSTPSNHTYFSTTDTTINVTFMIGPNIFSEQRDKSRNSNPESIIEFNPVALNLVSGLRKPIEFMLTERRKRPLTSAL